MQLFISAPEIWPRIKNTNYKPWYSAGCYHSHLTYRESETTWWRHQMETFSASLAICEGNSPVPVKSPPKGQWRGAFRFSLICVWINGWVNNREAGYLRRYPAHYDVIVMKVAANLEMTVVFYFQIKCWNQFRTTLSIRCQDGFR